MQYDKHGTVNVTVLPLLFPSYHHRFQFHMYQLVIFLISQPWLDYSSDIASSQRTFFFYFFVSFTPRKRWNFEDTHYLRNGPDSQGGRHSMAHKGSCGIARIPIILHVLHTYNLTNSRCRILRLKRTMSKHVIIYDRPLLKVQNWLCSQSMFTILNI